MATTRELEPWGPLLETGRADERLVHEQVYGARSARFVSVPGDLNHAVLSALEAAGINELYEHQAEALQAAFDGPTIVTTGTASGKSLCFQLPTLEVLTTDRRARALYLYPTKALAQDQARALHAFGLHQAIRPAIYDGDTPRPERAAIRKRSNLILTNPDMLHVGILPNHPAWATSYGAYAGSPRTTGPSRGSCSRARRSPTRSSSPNALPGWRISR
jgi:DEAD/DEAH box helicase domain-containing protein